MSVIKEVFEELWSMFVGDRRLTLLLLLVVGAAAAAAGLLPRLHIAADAVILLGAAALLADSVRLAARKARR